MTYRFTIIAVVLFVTTAAFGSAAYTSYSADRTGTVEIVNDDAAVLALTDGDSTDDMVVQTGGKLQLNVSEAANAPGPDVTMKVGDESNANTTYAFSITNNDDAAHNVTVKYAMTTDPDGTTNNVQFKVYDSSNTLLKTVSEADASGLDVGSVASGSTVYVVVVVDTSGLAVADSLSGTLTVSTA